MNATPKQILRHKAAVFLLACVPNIYLFFLITYGIYMTPRTYAPTISTLLSDYIELSVSFGFLVANYTVIESYVVVEYINHVCDDSEMFTCVPWCRWDKNVWRARAPFIAGIFLMLKNASLIMVVIVRADEYPTMHYVWASLSVLFLLVMFAFYIIRRSTDSTKSNPRIGILVSNYVHFFLILALSLTFGFGVYFNSDLLYNHNFAIIEYAVFYLYAAVPIHLVFDIGFKYSCCQSGGYEPIKSRRAGAGVVYPAPQNVPKPRPASALHHRPFAVPNHGGN